MNRIVKRIRTASEEHVYKFSSNWVIWVLSDIIDEEQDPVTYCSNEELNECLKMFNKYTDESTCDIIKEHLNDQDIPVTNISFELNENCVATVTTSEELTDDQINEIKDELEGQYSDGFGEGLEQQAITETENDDDESDVIETYVKLWPRNFKMTVS